MFIAALFKVAKTWKQSNCPSVDDWIKKCYKSIVEYYLAIKNNEILSFAAKWMDLESVTLTEMSDQKEQEPCDCTHVGYKTKSNQGTNKLIDTDNRVAVTRGEGGTGRMKTVKGVKYMVTKGDSTLGGEHTMQHTDDIS